jgi:catechol 2,3-dioxygenase-like lactoylglutathione lyase family enzyme
MNADTGVTELEHVLVLSADIERSRDFYERALGMQAGDRPPFQFTGYWLYASGRPCLHIADRASYRAHVRTLGLDVPSVASGPGPVDHIAFRAADYEALERRLAALAVRPVRNQVPNGGPRQLFFDDPDGTRIEINVTAPTTKAGLDD